MSAVWPFVPQRQMKETMQWKTEIIRCRSAEQRIALRFIPRTILEFNFQLLPQEIEAATVLARTYGATEFIIPFWHELESLGDVSSGETTLTVDTTTKRYLVGSAAFIIGNDGSYETVNIDTVNSGSIVLSIGLTNSYSDAVVMPAYPCYFTSPFRFRKYPAMYLTATFQCVVIKDFGITSLNPYPSFNNSYVLTDRPIGDITDTQAREFKPFGNIAGPITYSKPYTYAISHSSLTWSFNNVAEVWAFRLWLYAIKGKQESFYVPRWTRDFIPSVSISSVDDFVIVNINSTLADTYTGAICIVKTDGSLVYKIVDGWTYYTGTEIKMDLTTTVGEDISLSEIELICRMPKVRFNSDNVEFNYKDGKVVDVRLPIMEVPE